MFSRAFARVLVLRARPVMVDAREEVKVVALDKSARFRIKS